MISSEKVSTAFPLTTSFVNLDLNNLSNPANVVGLVSPHKPRNRETAMSLLSFL